MTIKGTSGNDTLTGTSGDDLFAVGQGGHDTVSGLAGDDAFHFGASFDAGDSIDGGTGTDTLLLNGDYSAGVTFGAGTMINVEQIKLAAGFDYNLTTDDTTVAAGRTLSLDAAALGSGNGLTFDGSAELDGRFIVKGGAGDDVLTGGAGNDIFRLESGGNDSASGGDGNDVFVMGASLTAGDRIDGGLDRGNGHNTLRLDGDYSAGLTLGADTIQNIQNVQFDAGHSYDITVDNANFLSGPTVVINAGGLGAGNHLTFDASASDAGFHFIGGAGNDVLTAGTAANIFDLSHGGADTVTGGGLGDVFLFGQTLNAGDTIDGGGGTDTVDMTGMNGNDSIVFGANTFTSVEILKLEAGQSYDLGTVDGNVAAGATLLVAGNQLGAGDTLTFDGSAETDGHFVIRGGAGNDNLTGGALSDTFNLTLGGTDTAHGGDGDDIFNIGATLTAADTIDGGAGNDTLTLDGDYSAGLVFGAATMTNVETLDLVGGHSYNLTPNTANVAHGATLTVDASTLGAADSLTFDASHLEFLTLDVTAGAGNDVITGPFSAANTIDLSLGGNDTVHSESGGVGTYLMGGALTANDQIDGGGNGSIDLDGDYTGANAVIFNATTITNMENLTVEGGHSYDLTANAATLGTHALRVFATGLLAGDTLTFDGSATITGVYQFNAGAGSYSLIGGSLNDQFNMGASFTASDHVDGGAAGDDALDLNGDYSGGLVFGATTMVNIQNLQLSASHSYDLTTDDATVASGATLTVDASALGAGDTMTFDGSAETDGYFAITGGAGNDTVTVVSGHVLAGSTIDGGAGSDTVILNGDFSTGIAFSPGTITNVETLHLDAGHSYILTTDDANVASGATLTVDASALGAGDTMEFAGSAETDGFFAITGGAGNDMVTIAGPTVLAGSTFDGGGGNDTLVLDGDYSGGFTFGAATMTDVGTLTLDSGFSYNLTTDDANVAAGATLTVDASTLGAGDTLTFDGSAETDGIFHITGGAGDDTVTIANASVLANSQIDGGSGGNDTLVLNGDFSAPVSFASNTVKDIDTITLDAGHSYSLSLSGATVASGGSITIDGSALGAGGAFNFGFASFGGGDATYILKGGAGSDAFSMLDTLTAADQIDGGGGANYLFLNGDYSAGITFNANTIQNISAIFLVQNGSDSYNLTTDDGNVAAGQTLGISAGNLLSTASLTFNGAAETDGFFDINSSAGTNILTGGALADSINVSSEGATAISSITGGGGADLMTAGAGADTFVYNTASDSTSTTHDIISGFDAGTDKFDFHGIVGGYDGTIDGTINAATFDSDIGNAFNDNVTLHGDHAWTVLATGGDLVGHTFLVVDTNNNAGYDAGTDYVIDITGFSGSLTAGDFT